MNGDLKQLKDRMRSTWIAGDFGKIARYTEKGAEEFVGRLSLGPGVRVLDVACGTGNLAIPAARTGAEVTGADIAPNLIEQARSRAAEENLAAVFEEGDAEELPYGDGAFDVVMTMFGAMFAPRPGVVAAELARVCRPGGVIAMANWTAAGFVGKNFGVSARHVPPPPGVPAPAMWGDEAVVRERLQPYASEIRTTRRLIDFDYPYPPREVVQFFREYFGPTKAAYARLDEEGQKALSEDMEVLWRSHNEGDENRTLIRAEYLEVVAIRA